MIEKRNLERIVGEKIQQDPLSLTSILDGCKTAGSKNVSEPFAQFFKVPDVGAGVLPATELFERNLLCRADVPDLVAEKVAELQKRFNIKIPPEGTEVKKPHVSFGYGNVSDKLAVRKPTMAELEGLEAALVGTQPLSTPRDGKTQLTFYFLPEPFMQRDSSIAMYARDAADAPAVFVYGTGTKDRPSTEKDTKEEPTWQTKTFSLQRMLTHELSHYFQDKNDWGGDKAPPELAKALGWVKLDTGRGPEYGFKGKDGTLYRQCGPGAVLIDDSFISIRESMWVPCNEKGEFSKGASNAMLSTVRMAEKAAVRPATSYFTNPKEMHAESLCAFRLDAKWRALLMKTDKTLYAVIKEQDQTEIDRAFPGSSARLRHPDGHLVPATTENKKIVADFERAP
ncbi:MAG: hypothetical protein K2W95_29660 [Candidatus Obscuribacterales bacterium]|nr:hypothetical protein [Candidatus Obscuribacterales bacterium]